VVLGLKKQRGNFAITFTSGLDPLQIRLNSCP